MARKKLPLRPREWANPYNDSSRNHFWASERRVIERLLVGDELVQGRWWLKDADGMGVYWYWTTEDGENLGVPYPEELDGTITRLLSRGIIRPVRCAGGYTWMVLTAAAMKRFAGVAVAS